ncbi:MAG: hypothetical protein GY809_32505 [Planctomycetes bacterium]|nr:hypothetical protein [Planctomycetota bacterium]
MQPEPTDKGEFQDVQGEGTPVCVKCFQPVNPLANYCAHCGGATGNFTHYLPFTNIRWQASVWGQALRQIRSRNISLPGRLFRLFMILWQAPIILIGLLFTAKPKTDQEEPPPDIQETDHDIEDTDL